MIKQSLSTLSYPREIPAQTCVYDIRQIDSLKSTGLGCWIAVPNNPDPSLAPLVAVHGVLRDVEGMLKTITSRLPQGGRVIIAPVFDATNWHGYQRIFGQGRADLALLTLLKSIRIPGGPAFRSLDFLGYSGGAQFAHRFALLYPHLIGRLGLCSAGWYTFPDDRPYPYGLSVPTRKIKGFTPLTRANLSRFLSLPIDVYVGDLDDASDANLRRGKVIDRQQGTNRLERASNWVAALNKAASVENIRPDIKLGILKKCGHDFRECVHLGGLIDQWLARHPENLGLSPRKSGPAELH